VRAGVDRCGVFGGRGTATVVGDPAPGRVRPVRVTYRTRRVLAVIAAQSDLSNSEVGARAGISDQGQISTLLAGLARLGLAENTGAGQAKGTSNAWRLTRRGREVERAIRSESGGTWR
jgi:hypothetical protein